MTSRRAFLRRSLSAAAVTIVPRSVLGGPGVVAPNAKVSALLGGRYSDWGQEWKGPTAGREPARRLVEAYYGAHARSGKYRGCATHVDYRELLEKEKDLDAVVVGTPDHTHAVISTAAMRKRKHVYCQKPLTHSIHESRAVAQAARENGVATQLAVGNQASEATRLLCEWIGAGAIGPVREVHNWTSRPFWPQAIERPPESEPVPATLDWDLFPSPPSSTSGSPLEATCRRSG